MNWQRVERGALAASAVLFAGSSVVGFGWVRSPYLKGYLSLAGALLVLSRLAASFR